MEHLEYSQSYLPEDIALKIASSLEVSDLCALGSCSRFWRGICGSDCLWKPLTIEKWPFSDSSQGSSPSSSSTSIEIPISKGWKSYYIQKHNEMADRVAEVVDFVRRSSPSESIQVGDYLRAIDNLHAMQLGLKDVQLNFFNPKLTALLNLVGLHYCIKWLQVQAEEVLEALERSKILDRQVIVRWWKRGRLFYGFPMRVESDCYQVSLADLATERGDEVLGVLHRGAIHGVSQVQISVADCSCSPWFCQENEKHGLRMG